MSNPYIQLAKQIIQFMATADFSTEILSLKTCLYVEFSLLTVVNLVFYFKKVHRLQKKSFYLLLIFCLQANFICCLLLPYQLENIRTAVEAVVHVNLRHILEVTDKLDYLFWQFRIESITGGISQFFLNVQFLIMEIKYWTLA